MTPHPIVLYCKKGNLSHLIMLTFLFSTLSSSYIFFSRIAIRSRHTVPDVHLFKRNTDVSIYFVFLSDQSLIFFRAAILSQYLFGANIMTSGSFFWLVIDGSDPMKVYLMGDSIASIFIVLYLSKLYLIYHLVDHSFSLKIFWSFS